MSRYNDWTNALVGITSYLTSAGVELNEWNNYKEKALIYKFTNKRKIKGSYTDRILAVSKQFDDFKKFIKEQKNPHKMEENADILTE